jgi:hypothetical protein
VQFLFRVVLINASGAASRWVSLPPCNANSLHLLSSLAGWQEEAQAHNIIRIDAEQMKRGEGCHVGHAKKLFVMDIGVVEAAVASWQHTSLA